MRGQRGGLGERRLQARGVACPITEEHQARVERGLGLQLTHDERAGLRAAAPVDETVIVAGAVLAYP